MIYLSMVLILGVLFELYNVEDVMNLTFKRLIKVEVK